MAIPNFTPVENYAAFKILKQVHLNALAASVKTQFDTYTKLNFQQLALDIFGVAYPFNNDGLATLATPLADIVGQLAQNETVTGSWTFTGQTSFQNSVTSNSGFTSTGQPRVRAYINAAQSIADSVVTSISFNTETYDVGSMHDNVSPTRLTVPNGAGGVYLIDTQVTFAASAVGRREVYLYKNGSLIATQRVLNPDGALSTEIHLACQDVAVAADFYEVKVFQNSGGALNVNPNERITYVSTTKVW